MGNAFFSEEKSPHDRFSYNNLLTIRRFELAIDELVKKV
jgi:hypothetical protein